MKKPSFISHYLVLRDLIKGENVRQYNDNIVYLTSRIENVKADLKETGLRFDERATAFGTYASYKPYILIDDTDNMKLAEALLEKYSTPKVKAFLQYHESKTV